MNDDALGVLFCLFGLAVVWLFVWLIVVLVRKSNEKSRESEQLYSQIAQQLPTDKQAIFHMQYSNVQKSMTTAVLLALLLGGLGAHKFYMGQPGKGILYLLFCWTGIPALIALVDAFLMPITVSKYNQRKMTEIAIMLGALPSVERLTGSA